MPRSAQLLPGRATRPSVMDSVGLRLVATGKRKAKEQQTGERIGVPIVSVHPLPLASGPRIRRDPGRS
jgi:hypothetical protein